MWLRWSSKLVKTEELHVYYNSYIRNADLPPKFKRSTDIIPPDVLFLHMLLAARVGTERNVHRNVDKSAGWDSSTERVVAGEGYEVLYVKNIL